MCVGKEKDKKKKGEVEGNTKRDLSLFFSLIWFAGGGKGGLNKVRAS